MIRMCSGIRGCEEILRKTDEVEVLTGMAI
jgi:hypothetical protein